MCSSEGILNPENRLGMPSRIEDKLPLQSAGKTKNNLQMELQGARVTVEDSSSLLPETSSSDATIKANWAPSPYPAGQVQEIQNALKMIPDLRQRDP